MKESFEDSLKRIVLRTGSAVLRDVEVGFDEDLAAKIEQLLADAPLRARMGTYNRERFLAQMAWEHNAGNLLKAYERLCGPVKRGG